MNVLRADERLWMVRVDKGEEVVASLLAFAARHDVRCGETALERRFDPELGIREQCMLGA